MKLASLALMGAGATAAVAVAAAAVINSVLKADFTSNVISGYSPLEVQFTDTSSGGPQYWNWDFGDGEYSTEKNPTHTYNAIGTYSVSLIVDNGQTPSQMLKIGYIVAIEGNAPEAFVAKFGFTTDIENPLKISFVDMSTGHPGKWSWQFGDGGTSGDQNPIHEYSSPGTYHITFQCSKSGGYPSDGYDVDIEVGETEPIHASFKLVYNPNDSSIPVVFTDTSTGNPTSWLWTFGDGGQSTDQNPTWTYTLAGTWYVQLTVYKIGVSDSSTDPLEIVVGEIPNSLVADFTWEFVNGSTTDVQFTDTSKGYPDGFRWIFGDGSQASTEQNPIHSYTVPGWPGRPNGGTYSPKLEISRSGGGEQVEKTCFECITIDDQIYVNGSFDYSPHRGIPPLTVTFTSTTTGNPDSEMWDFGDGSDNVNTQSGTVTHTYTDYGVYRVILTPYKEGYNPTLGMADVTVALEERVVSWTYEVDSSNPHLISFQGVASGFEPSSWFWEFGESSNSYSIEQNPTFEYASAGTYHVKLQSGVSGGPYYASYEADIVVTDTKPPLPLFADWSYAADVTHPHIVAFTDASTGGPEVWAWQFGDGNQSNEQNPIHEYATAGTYHVVFMCAKSGGTPNDVYGADIVVTNLPEGDITIGNFSFSEVISDNLPQSCQGWSMAWCPGDGAGHDYQLTVIDANPLLAGKYRVTSCYYGNLGSHGGCGWCAMVNVVVTRIPGT